MTIGAGDLVRNNETDVEMLVIGSANDDRWEVPAVPSFFCVWERQHFLHEEAVSSENLTLVRVERRRVPRGGILDFPCT